MDLDVDVARPASDEGRSSEPAVPAGRPAAENSFREIERNQGYIRGFEQDQATVAAHPLSEKGVCRHDHRR